MVLSTSTSNIETLMPTSSTIISTSTSDVSSQVETSSLEVGTTLTTMVSPTSTLPNSSSTPNPYTFKIEISNQRQYVGAWYGTYIRDDLLSLLHLQCENKRTGANTCKTTVQEFNNIEYSNKYGILEKGKSVVNAHVESDYIPEEYESGGLQNAFIERIADTMMFATLDNKKCYQFDRKTTLCLFCKNAFCSLPDRRGRVVKSCSAPQSVKVSVVEDHGKEVAHMKINIEFTGKTDQGKFDCVAIRGVVDGNARKEREGKLDGATEGQTFEVDVECEGEEVTGSCPNEKCLCELGSCFE